MGLRLKKRKNGGFTMVEMLVVAAILIILMAFGFVEIVKQSRYLKVTEMDNMARSIYFAADNRAVLLARSGQLTASSITADSVKGTSLPAAPGSTSKLYYIKYSGADLSNLVPVGTIDPTLRAASFYIVYDIAAGCVKDVFYDEKSDGENFTAAFTAAVYGGSGKFETFYEYWSDSPDTSRQMRADNKIYIGHYGGEGDPPPAIPTSTGPTGPIEVIPEITITNGEKLELSVKYFPANDEKINGWKLEVELTYGLKKVILPFDKGKQLSGSDTWTYTLDALGGPYFKDLVWKKDNGSGVMVEMDDEEKEAMGVRSLGGVFEITAKMVEKASGDFTGSRANLIATPATARRANSLFDDASNDNENKNRAIIANLRHLQNLDEAFSGVLNKTEAFQIAEIDASKLKDNSGNVVNEDYKFCPINNSQLKLYRSYLNEAGESYAIKNMTVTSVSTGSRPGAGLFASASGTSGTDPFRFENVWLINATVDGGGKPAGSIVGTATNAEFSNCRVYWTDTAKLEKDGKVVYKIQGGNSATGGLVGELSNGEITNSFAATTIQGKGTIGGLVGKAKDVTIEKAYADCYLKGETAALRAGGLIGKASDTTLTNVYSTGFIEWTNTTNESVVAGFCAEGSNVTAENAYSGVYYQATGDYASALAGGKAQAYGAGVTNGGNCYAAWGAGSNSGYEALKSLALGPAFESKDNIANSHPYRLGKNSGLGNYEARGIVGLPHYGDWANGNQGGLPVVWVENGEELQAKIQVKGDGSGSSNKPHVKLVYGDKEVAIPGDKIEHKEGDYKIVSSTESEVFWTVTLDSLNGPHFKDWWESKISSFGGDFSVLASTGGSTWTKKSAKSSGNSLFASGTVEMKNDEPVSISSGSTAYIENLRHLQNLDNGISGVSGKTEAVQTKDIDGRGHAFTPIANGDLQKYTVKEKTDSSGAVLRGEYCDINGLKVTGESSKDKAGAGLFAKVSSTGSAEKLVSFKFENVSLKGADITSNSGTIPTGALVGNTSGVVEFTNCKVTGSVTGNGDAGGLVGSSAGGSVVFTSCKVDIVSTIKGNKSAGGIIGSAGGSAEFTSCSVTAVTVTVTGGEDAGGLVGNAGNGFVSTSCNVAATVTGSKDAGGLVGRAGNDSVFTSCDVKATVTGGKNAGGLAGSAGNGAQFKSCIVDGTGKGVTGSSSAGGLVGSAGDNPVFTFCNVTGKAVAESGNAGGLVGSAGNGAQFKSCIVDGTGEGVTGSSSAGGLVGSAGESPEFNSCKVTNATVSATAGKAGGLLGFASAGAEFKRCKTESTTVSGTDAGGLAGYVTREAVFDEYCAVGSDKAKTVAGSISGTGNVGGLAGYVGTLTGAGSGDALDGYKVSGLTVTGVGTGKPSSAGGLVGHIGSGGGTFANCEAVDGTKIEGSGSAGGLVGKAEGTIGFETCKATGITVQGAASAGGLLGEGVMAKGFTECTVEKVTVNGAYAGGLAGVVHTAVATGNIGLTDCAAKDAKVSGSSNAGGLLGSVDGATTLTNCLATSSGITSSAGVAGGLVGNVARDATFTSCEVKTGMTVTGKGGAGGLMGKATGSVTFDGCTGNGITVKANVGADERGFGGLAGYVDGTVKMTSCQIDDATVQNVKVTVEGNAVTAQGTGGFRDCIGGLVGYVKSEAQFTNCSVGLAGTVNVWGADSTSAKSGSQAVFVGGMVGYVKNSSFEVCKVVQATVRGIGRRSCVGGLTGYAGGVAFRSCTVGDTIGSGGTVVGAIAIVGSSNYEFPDYYTADAEASYDKLSEQVGSGGMIGYAMDNVSLSDCKVVGNVSVKGYKTADHVGGFVGYANKVTGTMLTRCEIGAGTGGGTPMMESGAGGSEVGAGHVGGMVGFAQPDIALTDCTADSIVVKKNEYNVAGLRGVGGLVGFVGTMRYKGTYNNKEFIINGIGKATLTRCKTIGSTNVTSKGFRNRVGGLVGYATVADFKGCEVGDGTGRVTVECLFASLEVSDGISANNKIRNERENVDQTVFVGGMIGSSAPDSSDGVKTTFNKDTNENVCKVVNTDVSGEGPRACVGGIMGLADQTTFADCIVGEEGETPSVTVSATSMNKDENLKNNTGGVGGIAGYANVSIDFTDCTVINAKVGKDVDKYKDTDKFDAGGILGSTHQNGTFTRCKVGGDDAKEEVIVNGARFTGGIVGFVLGEGNFTDCGVNRATVSSVHISESAAGGVLGSGTGNTTMSRCTVEKTTVNANNTSGGTGSVTNKRACAGGIAGEFIGEDASQKIKVEMTNCTVKDTTMTATSVGTGGRYKGDKIGYQENVETN